MVGTRLPQRLPPGVARRASRQHAPAGLAHRSAHRRHGPRPDLPASHVDLALFVTGSLVRRLGRALRLGTGPQDAWDTRRWPVVAVVAVTLVLVLHRSGPASSRPAGRTAPGGTLAVALLLAAPLGFALCTAHVGTCHRLYGSPAGVVVFLGVAMAVQPGSAGRRSVQHRADARRPPPP
ncbi:MULTISPECIES: YhjD/YihY/BrkB family envelope integrity protein [Streptomyces]|uniref:YhjD/YihY/BrkB family envelope integrity protein n=1 Tax=Streptomyces fimbriatus TaxID=68197 RepID=A0ABW0CZL8_STRFI